MSLATAFRSTCAQGSATALMRIRVARELADPTSATARVGLDAVRDRSSAQDAARLHALLDSRVVSSSYRHSD